MLVSERIEPQTTKIDSDAFRSLFTPAFIKLKNLFEKNGFELRIAGGAARDLLMGIRPADVDFASTATPTQMKDLFDREQIRMLHKRGEEHGTITCRLDDCENFEITTLRVDKVCDGRRAEVEYTTEWQLDANRRDLTINSLFLDLDGTVIDYFGGIADVKARRVRFVGDAEQRIQEDYLRILRYFRFFGRIALENAKHDDETIEAIIKNRDGLLDISAERIWVELRKIVIGRMATDVVECMLSVCGLHPHLGLPEKSNISRFKRVFEQFEKQVEPMTMIATLCEDPKQIAAFHSRTKLSNVEKVLGEFIVRERSAAEANLSNQSWWRRQIVELDVRPGHDNHKMSGRERVLQLAMSVCADKSLLEHLDEWPLPHFPIKGPDLMTVGVNAGPHMRVTLLYLFDLWVKSEYVLTADQLLAHAHDAEIPELPAPKKRKISPTRQ